jgi:phospholipase D1/2
MPDIHDPDRALVGARRRVARLSRMGRVLRLDAARAAGEREPARSVLAPGWNCCAVATAERATVVVDTDAYYKALHQALLAARHSVLILAWDFNSRTQLHFEEVPRGGPPAVLGELLNWLVHRHRSLHVRVLNWDYPMVFGTDREFPPLYGFGWTPARRVHLRYDDTHPLGGSQHQKVVVIDDRIAFSGGIDLTVKHWDTRRHKAEEPRRVCDGKPYPPYHDVMALVDGEAARALGEIARERWRVATGEKLRPVPAPAARDPDPWPGSMAPEFHRVAVGIARTMPPRGDAPAVREVERLYLDMIAAAKRSIYIENQYFTATRIAAALEKRLGEPDGPEVVLVLRLLSHGWLEEHTMHVLRTRLIERLTRADRHHRLKVYYPHVPNLPEGCCLDIHSKVTVVDDSMLRVGSANVSRRSMGLDSECDLLIEALDRPDVAAAIRAVRNGLLAEHLDCRREEVDARLKAHPSLHTAIASLQKEGKTLKELTELPEWSDAVVEVASLTDPDEPIEHDFHHLAQAATASELPRGPRWGVLAMIAAAFLALAALWRFTPLAEVVTAERAIEWAKDFGSRGWAPFAVMLAYTPACFVMFPRPLITLAAVIAFGPWLGFFYALVGITFSAAVTYYAGQHMRRDTVRRIAGAKLDRIISVLRKHGLVAMTLLRLVPLAPFAVEGIVAGAVRLKLWHLLVGTAIGLTPGTLAATIFGDQIETAVSTGQINWWLVGGVIGVLFVGAIAVKRWFTRMAGETAPAAERSGGGPG